MSYIKPRKNKTVLDGLILNLMTQKNIIIEIKLGVAISNNEKKLKDFCKLIKQNKSTKNNKLFENS